MVTVFSRRAVMAGTIGGAFLLTGCDVSRPATPSPSPHESTASPTAIEPQTDESIQHDVLARLAAAGITSINVDVDAHGHGGAHVFIDGSIESLDQLLQALQIGYDTASEHQDYAVLATVTRAGTGRAGRRALEVTWALDENAEIGPRPEQLRPSARAALTMFPDAAEDATLQVDVNLDGMSASALVTCRQTSTASAAETYRRLRPAWRVPGGAAPSPGRVSLITRTQVRHTVRKAAHREKDQHVAPAWKPTQG